MVKTDQKKGRDWVRIALLLLELAFILVTLVGAWFIYWPGALLLAGFLGIMATEKLGARREAPRPRIVRRERAS